MEDDAIMDRRPKNIIHRKMEFIIIYRLNLDVDAADNTDDNDVENQLEV